MTVVWQDALALFGLRVVELLCFCYFLTPLPKRKPGTWVMVAQVLAFSFLLTLAHEVILLFPWEGEFVYINFAYYPLVFLFVLLRFDIPILEGVYYLLLFFLCAHNLRPLVMQISKIAYDTNYLVTQGTSFYHQMFLGLFGALLSFEFAILKGYAFRYPNHRLTWTQLGLVFIATIPLIYVTNLFLFTSISKEDIPFSAMMIGVVCGFCGLVIAIGFNNTLALERNRQDLLMLQTLLATQKKQYQLKKDTIELINARYHDLKKHINYLASIDTPSERAEYLETLKLQISPFDAFHDTGNDTLDIVLSDKDMECRKNDIGLLLFIDGKKLAFVNQLDIVAIFCNAIDNGIEAVRRLPEEQRSITVRMREYDTWLVVTFENSFAGELKWKGSRLASTKDDGDGHGYGLRNVETTVEKYGGNVTVDAQGDRFVLTILFPKVAEAVPVGGSVSEGV